MKSRANEVSRTESSRSIPSEGPNWILIAGGALLSTLSIRLGYKLRQLQDTKQINNDRNQLKEKGRASEASKSTSCQFHSNEFCYNGDQNGRFRSLSDSDVKQHCRENSGVRSSSSSQLLELPHKPFNRSQGSESPSISEAGSDLFTNREMIQKLRQQLKRRDEMIIEMQDQIAELQNSLNTQISNSTHLQSLLDSANRDLFDSEREIQRLRKAITDYCVGQNGHENGYNIDTENSLPELLPEKSPEMEKMEMLKREVNELKEIIQGKEYLMQNYKEQKIELSSKVKELQQRLDFQLPNIL